MLIHIQDDVLEFDNDPKKVKQIFKKIDGCLSKKELRFSYFIIDDVIVSDKAYQYFTEHIQSIKKVEVILETLEILIQETIQTTHDYIENAMPLIMTLSEEFYRKPSEKTWKELNDLFGGVQWIIESLTQIDGIKNLSEIIPYETWNEYVQITAKLMTIVPELEEAILAKDMVLIGDMLLYEMMPTFEKMRDKLLFLLPVAEDLDVS